MTTTGLVIVLFVAAAALLFLELMLPTHGLLGVLGIACLLGGIGVCFAVNAKLGFAVLCGVVIASPFVAGAAMRIWPRTWVGRRLVLDTVNPTPLPQTTVVAVGDRGVAVSALRPMGECDFRGGAVRIEALSDYGVIEPGRGVVVVSVTNGRVTVRAAEP